MKAQRQPLDASHAARKVEGTVSEIVSASLDCYRALRDAVSEATFFQIYGNLYELYLSDETGDETTAPQVNARELPFVRDALAAIDKGGYPEALARVAFLMAHRDEPLPLSRLQLAHELIEEYHDMLPDLAPDQARRIAGEQEIIARYEPEKAIETLPLLLARHKDRERLLSLLERVLADPRVQRVEPSDEQKAMLARIRAVLGAVNHVPRASRRGNGAARIAATDARRIGEAMIARVVVACAFAVAISSPAFAGGLHPGFVRKGRVRTRASA